MTSAARYLSSARESLPKLVLLLLFWTTANSAALAAASSTPADSPAVQPARVVFMKREIAVLRASIQDRKPAERATTAMRRIQEAIEGEGPGEVEVRDTGDGKLFVLDGIRILLLTPADINPEDGEPLEQAAQRVAGNLQAAVLRGRAKQPAQALGVEVLASLAATLALYVFIRLLALGRRRIEGRITAAIRRRVETLKVGGISAFHATTVDAMVRQTLKLVFVLLVLFPTYLWLEFCLLRIDYTRPVGELLDEYLLSAFAQFGQGLINGVPGLLTVLIIVVVTRAVVLLVRMFFDRVERLRIDLGWVDATTAPITRRLLTAVIWLFALAMAYPSIPGSDSNAFKGLSVLLGVMVSLGASSIVGQAASGLILVYSRRLRPGEFVRVGQDEGTVNLIGMFSTKIMTSSGEELSIPNSVIVGTTTRNYSRTPENTGGAIDTSVTIGYGTPWRQVHAMLLEAAGRTEGLRPTPEPYVRQSALNDFYVAYRLCARLQSATERVAVLDRLHQNIQDVFNEYGVQILSPHYEEDPAQPAVVPKERWYVAPARPPAATGTPAG